MRKDLLTYQKLIFLLVNKIFYKIFVKLVYACRGIKDGFVTQELDCPYITPAGVRSMIFQSYLLTHHQLLCSKTVILKKRSFNTG